jgi:hypothetical protein
MTCVTLRDSRLRAKGLTHCHLGASNVTKNQGKSNRLGQRGDETATPANDRFLVLAFPVNFGTPDMTRAIAA